MKKRIGVMGGSYNPIHNDHLWMIRTALEKMLVDELWLVPCKDHPFDKKLAPAYHRLKMMELAIKDIKNVKIEKYELDKEGKSYTADTMKYLKNKYPYDFSLVIGSDLLKDIERWDDFDYLKKLKYIVFKRENYPVINKGLDMIVMPERGSSDISSSNIRNSFLRGEDISDLLPKSVEDYITENDVYIDTTEHKNPASTVDMIVHYDDGFTKGIVLIQRKEPPFKGHWGFPGGHLNYGKETLEEAAVRELWEETGLVAKPENVKLLAVYSDPRRDPRGHVVSHAYIIEAHTGILKAGSDAKKVGVFSKKPEFMTFDHSKIWDDYMEYAKKYKAKEHPILVKV